MSKHVPVTRLLYDRALRTIRKVLSGDQTQAGELTIIKKLMKDDFPPYLVDVGAHDGGSISNSSFFVERGWQAILIEPAPRPFERLSEKYKGRENVVCVNVACSNRDGVQDFFFGTDGPNGMLGTLCTDDNEWFALTRSEESIQVPVERLTRILIENDFPHDFSLLFIDTEGMDYECLLGLDFERFAPWIIVTEEYGLDKVKNRNKHQLLRRNGYQLHRAVGANTIWVRKEVWNKV